MSKEAMKLALEALEAVQRTKVASHELAMCDLQEISAGRERLKTRLCEAMHNEQVLRLSAEAALRTALAEQPAQQEPCTWARPESDHPDTWESSCGVMWMFDEGGPKDNGFHFCYRCGKQVIEAAHGIKENT